MHIYGLSSIYSAERNVWYTQVNMDISSFSMILVDFKLIDKANVAGCYWFFSKEITQLIIRSCQTSPLKFASLHMTGLLSIFQIVYSQWSPMHVNTLSRQRNVVTEIIGLLPYFIYINHLLAVPEFSMPILFSHDTLSYFRDIVRQVNRKFKTIYSCV